MADPGQPVSPDQMANADQRMDRGTRARTPDAYADVRGPLRDADEEQQTLEHGGYGGEQEYQDSSTQAGQAHSDAGTAGGEYVNQTDMTDQTGDRSQSESNQQSRLAGQGRAGDMGITNDSRQGGE